MICLYIYVLYVEVGCVWGVGISVYVVMMAMADAGIKSYRWPDQTIVYATDAYCCNINSSGWSLNVQGPRAEAAGMGSILNICFKNAVYGINSVGGGMCRLFNMRSCNDASVGHGD